MPVRDQATARKAAQALLARGVGAVAIQAGDEGNLLVWNDGEMVPPRIPAGRLDSLGALAIQAGAAGTLLVWNDGELFLPRIPVDSVDATGAGDAFAGALAASL